MNPGILQKLKEGRDTVVAIDVENQGVVHAPGREPGIDVEVVMIAHLMLRAAPEIVFP